MDENDKPVSTPMLKHVSIYDLAIEKEVAVLRNEGHDIRTAFRLACKDIETRQVHFLANVFIEIGIAECKACFAPGLKESFPSVQVHPGGAHSERGVKRPAAETGESKAKRNRVKKEAKEAELKAQLRAVQQAARGGVGPGGGARGGVRAPPLQLQNGGVGDACGGK